MKILVLAYKFPHLEDSAVVSGEVKNPFNFCIEMVSQGHEVSVLTIDSVDKGMDLSLWGINIAVLPDLKLKGVIRYLYRAYSVKRWLDKNYSKYDLIHSHAAFLGLGALFSNNLSTTKFISTPHGTNVPEIGTELGANLVDYLKWINAWLQMKLDSVVYRKSLLCVSVSRYQIEEMQKIYGIDRSRIVVVYNGVSDKYDSGSSLTDREYDFLFVGRAAKKKGLDLIISLAEYYSNKTFKVVLGTRRFQTVGEEVIDRICSIKNIDVEWSVVESKMPAIFASAKLLIVPSRGYESLPTVILEAIRSKTRVVATRAWGNPEVILDERLMFSEDNVQEIIDAIDYAESLGNIWIESKYCVKSISSEVSELLRLVEG
ncbi:glycosyltransferase family 4 protein [Teredinibacter turnerae]|uniref:glycosyltransferase family 4 protein n=1 Tax=Teredinibacter turnerae TaxID=2426 RepID=UPI00035ECF8B|nr:glycosyltransferase family 4 protein [Teredinibacter turnerae]